MEGANGLGKTLARKLASAGEEAVDMPAKLSARVRVLSEEIAELDARIGQRWHRWP